MRRILKRLEALERAADREIFADAFSFAIAYHLGGARDLSEVMRAYAKALGYEDLHEFVRASAYLFRQESATLKERSAHEARIHQAQCELLAKFGYMCVAQARQRWLMPVTASLKPFPTNGLPRSNPSIGKTVRTRRGQPNFSKSGCR